MLKKLIKAVRNAVVFPAAVSIFLSGCLNLTGEKQTMAADRQYASLTIKTGSSSRAFDVNNIKFASVSIYGTDFDDEASVRLSDIEIPVSGGKNSSDILIEKIPVGKNRIVTVKALDENKNLISFCNLRAVADILPGDKNSVVVSKTTTSYGNVIWELKDFFSDLSAPSEETEAKLEELKAAVDDSVHPALFDYINLTSSYKAFSPLQDKSFYVLKTASVTFDYLLNDRFTVHVEDPVSKDVYYEKAGFSRVISGIAPGTWNLFISNSDGKIVCKTEINLKSGENCKLKHLPYNGIAVVMRASKGYDLIHYWNCKENPELKTLWPGEKFPETVAAENAEDTSYFVKRFPEINGISCLVTNESGSKYHAEDIVLNSQGVYCVHYDNIETLTEKNDLPDDFNLSDYPITEENLKTFYYDDQENKQIIMLVSPDKCSSSISSAKVYFNNGINAVDSFKGFSTSFKKDESGVWYALVPYEKIRATNQSGLPTYKLKINDQDFDVVSYLKKNNLNGYVYAKFSSKTEGKNLPVIIYDRPNKARIIQSLEKEKSYSHVSDFDLSNEEEQMKIANFRCVPGTTKLFRSYHPYEDSKKEFDTEPYRLFYVAKLAEKYGIKSDINVGKDTAVTTINRGMKVFDGNSVKEITNYLPDYYKRIRDSGSILFLYKEHSSWSYDTGYFNTEYSLNSSDNAEFYARCVGTIIKFINSHEGPYQLHCSIGTDRTGSICGILAALCGAEYSQIEEDYCASQNMGICEFRGPGCVRFVIEEFLRITDLDDKVQVPDLQKAVFNRLTAYGKVTADEINQCITKLGGKLPD